MTGGFGCGRHQSCSGQCCPAKVGHASHAQSGCGENAT